MRSIAIAACAAILGLGLIAPRAPAAAAEGAALPQQSWSFDGVFGRYDMASIQRGFQVYTEVCASCHGLKYFAFRNLLDAESTEDQAKAKAAEVEVEDGPDADGEMFTRPAILSDYFPSPFANDNAARASNNGALPPDLSLITKARMHGPDYLFALMTGYEEEAPEGFELADGMNYNHYFAGNQIAMPPPLFEDGVEYVDGTEASVEQMAADVTDLLAWVAEPHQDASKRIGIKSILFLIVLTALFYASKRKVWADTH
jgi:ubiquinol-cytochrome c reductase cytochrome c1 subunit